MGITPWTHWGGQVGCHGAWGLFNRFHWIYSEAECGGNAGTRRQKDWPETTLCVSWEDSWVDDGSGLVEVMPLDPLIGKLPRCQCKPCVKAGHVRSQVKSSEVKQPENSWNLVQCHDIVPLLPNWRINLSSQLMVPILILFMAQTQK